MDWQALTIAVLGSAGLTQAVSLIRETGPKQRALKKDLERAKDTLEAREAKWWQFMLRLSRWHTSQGVDETNMPKPPPPLEES